MPKTRKEKEKIIKEIEEKIKKQKIIILVNFDNLKSKELFSLRDQLKKQGNEIKVAKKTLTEIAFKKVGLKIDLKEIKKQVALVFGFTDEISPTKAVFEFSQNYPNLKILGGIFEGVLVEAEKINELAKLPSREELLAKIVSILSAPINNFVTILRGNLKNLVFLLSQIQSKRSNA